MPEWGIKAAALRNPQFGGAKRKQKPETMLDALSGRDEGREKSF